MAHLHLAGSPSRTAPPIWRRLRPDLREAVRAGAFALGYQTRRGLADHRLIGTDAQLRWPSRHHGMVQAHAITPLAEACGLTGALTAWALHAACASAAGASSGQISLTVPASLARDGTLLALTADALAGSGLPPGRLELALPAPAGGDACDDTLFCLSALRDLGAGVALEGFGRANACLNTLKRLPLTAVKLDRSLTRDVPADRAATSLLRATIDYAHALDIGIIACGVEHDGHTNKAQLEFLRRAGCDAVLERPGAGPAQPGRAGQMRHGIATLGMAAALPN